MNFEEFLDKKVEEPSAPESVASTEQTNEEFESDDVTESIDVQKAVVESLAADKAEQDVKISELEEENNALKVEKEALSKEVAALKEEIASLKEKISDESEMNALKSELEGLRAKCKEQSADLAKMGDVLSKNAETELSNKVALLDRDTDIPDRFPGETREHVLEVIAEARKTAEAEGRIRRAQLLEGVLITNESDGTLAERRSQLEKLFNENANIISGPVIEELEKMGISHKNGEDYLLPAEIIKRTY